MFDDKPIPNTGGQVPGNLPVGEPEDMFSGTDDSAPQNNVNQPANPDIKQSDKDNSASAQVPSALGAGVMKAKDDVPETSPIDTNKARPPSTNTSPKMPEQKIQTPPQTPASPPSVAAPSGSGQAPGAGMQTPAGTEESQPYVVKEPVLSKGLMAVIITVVVLLIIGGGGWLVYVRFIQVDEQDDIFTTEEQTDMETDNTQVEESFEIEEPVIPATGSTDTEDLEQINEVEEDMADDELLFGEPVDSDNDRLDDDREASYGTDPNKRDTDNDGVSDGDEVLIWNTDPLNPDSDGDGYLDGEEIKAGYNPAGEGKLFEPPTTTQQ
ncbi:MAG: hypothetical protein GF349_00050 [Candidatus Magasanikbacteria bacterium]|nr:hypothetical protein [Candidatus Magasanikbacteria bacterium]